MARAEQQSLDEQPRGQARRARVPDAPDGQHRGDDAPRGAARRAARHDRAPHPAAAGAVADRRVVLPRPLRPRPRRRLRRHERRAAPAHGAADGVLAVHRRDRAPRQRRPPRDGPAGRAQPDDRRPRHQPLRGLDPRDLRAARRPALGGAAVVGPRRRPDVRALRTLVADRRGLGGPGLPRLAARRHLAGRDRHAAARRRAAARPPAPSCTSTSTRRSSTASWSTPASSRSATSRPSSTSSPTCRPAPSGSPSRPSPMPGSCCSAARRSARRS